MSFKNYLLINILLIVTLPIQIFGQNKSTGYTLTCTFKGLPDKTKAYLTTQEGDTAQKAFSRGNQIIFNGKLVEDGRFHFIKFDTLVSKVESKAIFVSNKPITVKGILGERDVEVFGSPEQKEYNEAITSLSADFQKKMRIAEELLQLKVKEISNNSSLNDSDKYKENQRIEDDYNKSLNLARAEFSVVLTSWLLDRKTSLFSPYAMRGHLPTMTTEQINEVYNSFTPEVKRSYYGTLLKLELEVTSVAMGSTIPNFSLKNLEGRVENLHDLIRGGKYTLIDCWASWCKPCRAEVPNLKVIYEKYKNRGLSILGISSDKIPSDWKKAVVEDRTKWHQVIEIDGQLSKVLNLIAIPAYILVDAEGKLVAFDCAMSRVNNFGGSLRGSALDKKLEELLGKP